MSKLTEKERAGFEEIMKQDLDAINVKLMNQIKDFWAKAREEVLRTKGWDKLIEEKHKLNLERQRIIDRIHEIENKMNQEDLQPEQVVELGGKPNEYGKYRGSSFYGIPVTSQFEYDIVEFIRKNIDLELPAKFLYDLGRSCIRELTMSGTFEEARNAYQKFYSMDFRKYGVDIPPRLDDAKKEKNKLLMSKQVLSLPVESQKSGKLIEGGRNSSHD